VREIGDALKKTQVGMPSDWQAKLDMLCREYRKNIETLQK